MRWMRPVRRSSDVACILHIWPLEKEDEKTNMTRHTLATSLALAATLTAVSCSQAEETTTTAPEVQTQTAQQTNMPLTVSGCLKAGDADDMFVLTAARSEGSMETATYQLQGGNGANLQEHVGRQVQVTGTVQAQQEIASRGTAEATGEEARGTAGSATPTVQTRTEIDIKRLSVSSVKPLGDKCEM